MSNPLVDAIPATGNVARTITRQNLAEAVALPLKDAAAVAAFNTWNLATDGTLYEAVIYAGSVFDFDSGDTTTAHDPAGGCIVSGDGRRYKRSLNIKPDWIVTDKDRTAPPVSPSEGDAYYVAVGATGAWAGQDKNYALYGGRGWTFRDVAEGHILYITDEASYYHMPAGGTLTKGLGDLALASASIELKHLESPGGVIVEAEQNDPPVSPPDRIKYIVGAVPTGAWVGQIGKVAEYDSAIPGWVFHTWPTGGDVYDKAAGYAKRFDGAEWGRAFAESLINPVQLVDIPLTVNPGAKGTMETDMHVVSITAQTGQSIVIRINHLRVRGTVTNLNPSMSLTTRLRKDAEVTALLEYPSGGLEQVGNPGDPANEPGEVAEHTPINSATANVVTVFDVAADDQPHDYRFTIQATANEVTDPQLELRAEIEIRPAPVTTLSVLP